MLELWRALDTISEAPERWPEGEAGTRVYRLRRFPYLFVFLVSGEEIQVVAVVHAKRKPGYWRSRLGS